MRGNRLASIVVVMAALHVTVLSIVLALRRIGHIMAATPSATILRGIVCFLGGPKRTFGITMGAMIALVVQQVAGHVWWAEVTGFWRPLAQFRAL